MQILCCWQVRQTYSLTCTPKVYCIEFTTTPGLGYDSGEVKVRNYMFVYHAHSEELIYRPLVWVGLQGSFCLCVAGTVCDFRLSYGRVLNRRSKIIAVNRDKTQLLKNSDMFWKPTVAIQG